MTRSASSIAAALALACAAACSGAGGTTPDPPGPTPPPPPSALASGSGGGYTVRLVAPAAAPQVGLSALAVEVDGPDGARVTDAALEVFPLHAVAGGDLRCPAIGPAPAGADGRYAVSLVFQTPGTWTAGVAVTRGGATATVPLSPFQVAEGKNLAATFASGATGYVMALEPQIAPRVGIVPVAVVLYATEDGGATFAPVADATLGVDLQMPDMGHGGGPGTTAPVLAVPGWYQGKLDFSMEGVWTVEIAASRPGGPIGAPVFRVFF